ncbi:NYN domain-containing protein [Alteraurantiacibacter buctensis]|uniref:NYN domain-containing protein n=1 Tax=Alteraurantiacibacter buctensis TaxID=1503981 RepID=A0A844YZE2_9SPHN|nr:NYN domain-containing protein [Alteraurantiacibacter buctensis]MXO72141.1 NYN domain-containing protein [Alteraurantiacibacter buctensis]
MEERLKNIALLIDADNVSREGIDPVLNVLATLGQVSIRRAYGNWTKRGLMGWDKTLHRYGIAPHQQFDLTKGKNATDMAMTIDAMDLLYRGKVDGFAIMSSDSDFTPLAMRLRQDGVLVYGFGNSKTPLAFQTACTRFIEVDKLIASAAADAPPPQPEAEPAPANGPQPVDPEVVALIGKAWKETKRDEQGFARLAEIGKFANNRSSFDARNYGYATLGEMIGALPGFRTERRADGVYVKRVR